VIGFLNKGFLSKCFITTTQAILLL
jgi:hypothetical protein